MKKVMIVYIVILHVNAQKHEHHIQHQKDLQHHLQYPQIFLVQSHLHIQLILTQPFLIHILRHIHQVFVHTLQHQNRILQQKIIKIHGLQFYHNPLLDQSAEK